MSTAPKLIETLEHIKHALDVRNIDELSDEDLRMFNRFVFNLKHHVIELTYNMDHINATYIR